MLALTSKVLIYAGGNSCSWSATLSAAATTGEAYFKPQQRLRLFLGVTFIVKVDLCYTSIQGHLGIVFL